MEHMQAIALNNNLERIAVAIEKQNELSAKMLEKQPDTDKYFKDFQNSLFNED